MRVAPQKLDVPLVKQILFSKDRLTGHRATALAYVPDVFWRKVRSRQEATRRPNERKVVPMLRCHSVGRKAAY
jgi:hypothetical protein